MSEEKNTEQTTENTDDGDKPETASPTDKANDAAERLERANTAREKLLKREERLEANKVLGGESEAGGKPKKKTEDEKWAEEAKVRYEGTGMDPTE